MEIKIITFGLIALGLIGLGEGNKSLAIVGLLGLIWVLTVSILEQEVVDCIFCGLFTVYYVIQMYRVGKEIRKRGGKNLKEIIKDIDKFLFPDLEE